MPKPFTRRGIEFESQGAYRRFLAAERGETRRAYTATRKEEVASERAGQRQRAYSALGEMRGRGLSLTKAAAKVGISPAAAKRLIAPALTKSRGRYQALAADRLERRFPVIMADGSVSQGSIQGSADASVYGRYLNAVKTYQITGDPSRLREFAGKTITVNGQPHKLVVEPDVLRQIAVERRGESIFKRGGSL